MSFYIADLIINRNDTFARTEMINQTLACAGLDPSQPGAMQQATTMLEMSARKWLNTGEQETRVAMSTMRDAVRRLSAMPGQRSIVLSSPGMFTPFYQQTDKGDIIDRAIKAGVIINTLDARGLYTDPSFDASRNGAGAVASNYLRYIREAATVEGEILQELAHGTGGSAWINSNDYAGGFKRLSGTPEYMYMLGFSPQNLKVDGKYHNLQVTLKLPKGLTVQARKGFFAPKQTASPEEAAKQEIEEALFSREEMRDIPLEFRTQFFKTDDYQAKLSVISKISVKDLHFRKDAGRNCNDLTVVTALFDRNGNLVKAMTQKVEMKLLDETVASKLAAGLAIKTGFDVASGGYAIRVVLRDSEGQQMSAANGSVNIP